MNYFEFYVGVRLVEFNITDFEIFISNFWKIYYNVKFAIMTNLNLLFLEIFLNYLNKIFKKITVGKRKKTQSDYFYDLLNDVF